MNLVTYICEAGGSPDPAMNATLATVLKKAKADGVPKENIDKALARVNAFSINKMDSSDYKSRPLVDKVKTRVSMSSMKLWFREVLRL